GISIFLASKADAGEPVRPPQRRANAVVQARLYAHVQALALQPRHLQTLGNLGPGEGVHLVLAISNDGIDAVVSFLEIMLHPVLGVVLDDADTRLHGDIVMVRLQAEDHAIQPVLPRRRKEGVYEFLRRAGAIRPLNERLKWHQHESPEKIKYSSFYDGI